MFSATPRSVPAGRNRSAVITFPMFPSLPAPHRTHLHRYLYVDIAIFIRDYYCVKLKTCQELFFIFFVFRDLFEQNVANILDRLGQIVIADNMVIDRNVRQLFPCLIDPGFDDLVRLAALASADTGFEFFEAWRCDEDTDDVFFFRDDLLGALDLDLEDHIVALRALFLDEETGRSVIVLYIFSIFQKLIVFDRFPEAFLCDKEIIDAVDFSFPGLSCRHGNGIYEFQIFVLLEFLQDRPLAYAAGAGKYNQQSFFHVLILQQSRIMVL